MLRRRYGASELRVGKRLCSVCNREDTTSECVPAGMSGCGREIFRMCAHMLTRCAVYPTAAASDACVLCAKGGRCATSTKNEKKDCGGSRDASFALCRSAVWSSVCVCVCVVCVYSDVSFSFFVSVKCRSL